MRKYAEALIVAIEPCCQLTNAHRIDQAEAMNHCNAAEQAKSHTEKKHRFDLAVLAYRRALHVEPSCATCKANLSTCLLNNGAYEAAVDCLKEEMVDLTEPTRAIVNLGAAYFYLGRYREAYELLRSVGTAPYPEKPSSIYLDSKFNELCAFAKIYREAGEWKTFVTLYRYVGEHRREVFCEFDTSEAERNTQTGPVRKIGSRSIVK